MSVKAVAQPLVVARLLIKGIQNTTQQWVVFYFLKKRYSYSMKAQLLYRTNSEGERLAREFAGDYERQTGQKIDAIDVDTPEGQQLVQLYDIVSYPAIIARTDDGTLLQLWQGEPMPRISEVNYYAGS